MTREGLRENVLVVADVMFLGLGVDFTVAFSLWKKSFPEGFPGGSVVKNLSTNAGDMCSVPGVGRSHLLCCKSACVLQLLSPCSRAQEPQLLSPSATLLKPAHPTACARKQEKPLQCREVCTLQLEISLHLPQLEKSPSSKEGSTQRPPKKIIELHPYLHIFHIYYASVKKF